MNGCSALAMENLGSRGANALREYIRERGGGVERRMIGRGPPGIFWKCSF
jgi:hypothetical protein